MARLILLLMIAFLPEHAVCAGAEPARENPDPQRAEAATESHKIGRLFFSPDERAMLDRTRQKSGGSAVSSSEQITLNGIVRRSSGKTTAWINQVPQHENEAPQGVAVQQGRTSKPSALLLLPSGKKIDLKAGQTFDTAKGKVREGYEDATTVQPQKTTE
jgi:hypothetical protein